MSSFDSRFSRSDIETMIEAVGDWESLGNNEFHALQMVKNIPVPPEDHEGYEYIQNLKDYFRRREKEINDSRMTRQEKAVFIKTKLMLARRDSAVNELFDMAADAVAVGADADTKARATSAAPAATNDDEKMAEVAVLRRKLELAEYFINDLGVQKHYDAFLAEKANEV